MLTYNKRFGRKHRIDGLVGYTLQGRTRFRDGYESHLIPIEELGLSGIDNGTPVNSRAENTKNTLMSYLGRVNYNYDGKYLLTGTLRSDGSSKFSRQNRWAYFPSAAFAWRISREPFMRHLTFVDDAKLRLSAGTTGNNRIDDFQRFATLTLPFSSFYSIDNATPSPSVIASRMANDRLKWETTVQYDIGLDLSLFDSRANLVVDLYHKTTRDLLLNANIPLTSGFEQVMQNVGKISNRGLEFTLNTVNIKNRNFNWSSDFNISFNDNKVLALTDGETSFLTTPPIELSGEYSSVFLYMSKVGYPASVFYGLKWDGVYQQDDFDAAGNLRSEMPTNGAARNAIQPGDIKYRDINGDGVVDHSDYVMLGRTIPIHSGGFNNNLTYKGLSLNVFFQ